MFRLKWAALSAAVVIAVSGVGAAWFGRPETAYSQAGAPVSITNTSGQPLQVIDGASGQPVFIGGDPWVIQPGQSFFTHSWQGASRFTFGGKTYHFIGAIAGSKFQFFLVEDWIVNSGGSVPPAGGVPPSAAGLPVLVPVTPTPAATPTPTTPYVQSGGTNYLPNCGLAQIKGRIVNPDGIGRGGVQVRVSTGGWSATSNPSDSQGYWDVLLDGRPKAGSWDVQVIEGGNPVSPVVNVVTDTNDCGPNGSGRQVAVVDFRRTSY